MRGSGYCRFATNRFVPGAPFSCAFCARKPALSRSKGLPLGLSKCGDFGFVRTLGSAGIHSLTERRAFGWRSAFRQIRQGIEGKWSNPFGISSGNSWSTLHSRLRRRRSGRSKPRWCSRDFCSGGRFADPAEPNLAPVRGEQYDVGALQRGATPVPSSGIKAEHYPRRWPRVVGESPAEAAADA
jgi:hypothetical protein